VPEDSRPDAGLELRLDVEEEFLLDERLMHTRQEFAGPPHIEVPDVERVPEKMRKTAQGHSPAEPGSEPEIEEELVQLPEGVVAGRVPGEGKPHERAFLRVDLLRLALPAV
jgi:hypothetical protein